MTYIASALAALAAAACWHGFAGHGWHRTLLAWVRNEPPPPTAEHSQWWHDLTRPRKIAMSAAILAAGALTGLAWNLSPRVTLTACIALAGSTVIARSIRARLPRRGR